LPVIGLAAAVASCGWPGARAPAPVRDETPLVARAELFGAPLRHGGRLSPRGDQVAFLAQRDGVTNLWVLSVDAMEEARPLTDNREGGVAEFAWAHDNASVLYLQREQDGLRRLYAVSAAGGAPTALSPAGVDAEILGLSARDPAAVVVTLARGGVVSGVFRVEIATGAQTALTRNSSPRPYKQFFVDRDNRVRLGLRLLERGAGELVLLQPEGGAEIAVPLEDVLTTTFIGVSADGQSFLMLDGSGKDHVALVRVDLTTGAKSVLGENSRADVVDVWLDPATNTPEAFATEYLRREWRSLDAETQADIEFLQGQLTGDFSVVSRSADDNRWIVEEEGPTRPARSYLYDRGDRGARRLTLLFRHRPALEQAPLQPMIPVEIAARDGLTLVSYLTLPPGSDANGDGRPEEAAPLVLSIHGGPWARDSFGFSAMHQWLANRGYAVLSVNFRGSTGFGKAFLDAGNGEWGGRMQDDLLDATQWATESRIAQADRIAVVGAGFGGYAALSALATAPDRFRCGASYGAPMNLVALIERAPAIQRDTFSLRLGDPRSGEGRQRLRDRSLLALAGRVRDPVLLGYGERDPATTRAEVDQFASVLRQRGGLTYMTFPQEGGELARPQNRLSYLTVLEHFLGDCLGGRVEPVGATFEGASMSVYDGAVNVPGLSAFARRPSRPAPAPTSEAPDAASAPPIGPPP
jgi:dipeptidyl aminopeptidase/acylaminoacyl peptidase